MSSGEVELSKFDRECMEKGAQLEKYYEQNPEAAVKLVRENIRALYEGMAGLVSEMGELVEFKQELDHVNALKKIKIAKQMESRINEIMTKYQPFLDMMSAKKASMIASVMFTVKPEFVSEMAMVTSVLLKLVGQTGMRSDNEQDNE